ncbi:MAG: molybdenum cofactor guanylyltransferase [Candidatus Omnitrophota bacterium]|nr:molybdenum cofactor guanylyltransferase [Candidatus Omnitrophota bacterium]
MSTITGVILSGGKSTRMKTDKAFVKIGSKTMIEELISRLENKFSKLMIIANEKEKYAGLGIEVIKDIIPEKGPLGGIYTALVKSDSFYNFIFSCDAPFVNLDLIDYMISEREGIDIIVPRWNNRFEPLHAIYSKNCIEAIERQLGKNELKVTNFFQYVKVRVIDEKEISRFVSSQPFFANINTPQDLYTLSQ